ncbi:MAG TPA: lactate utilization protein LutB domain-containing protein, partial [Thermoanaerobaculia bacterium]|nr:lactate utilization protein LutB domain-containing protein [Thermoanaerobaculia bacterium]
VYTRVGGHAYEAVYPGPIGKIVTPQTEGLGRRHDLLEASSLCGACGEVCPVGIPIPELIVRLRSEAVAGGAGSAVKGAREGRHVLESAAWKAWRAVHQSPALYRLVTRAATRLRRLTPAWLPVMSNWTSVRSTPRPARTTLHELVEKEGLPDA